MLFRQKARGKITDVYDALCPPGELTEYFLFVCIVKTRDFLVSIIQKMKRTLNNIKYLTIDY